MTTCVLPERKSLSQLNPRAVTKNMSMLELLMFMGYPKNRAEKALSSTGHRGAQIASDWLLNHARDETLDDASLRDYVVFLVPVAGPLYDQITSFFGESLLQCGWNGAHNCVPHIRLTPFFKASHGNTLRLVETLRHAVCNLAPQFSEPLRLELYTSSKYMGLFVDKTQVDMIQMISQQFLHELQDIVSLAEPLKSKELHVSLAYHFDNSQHPGLEALANRIDCTASAQWEVRLYSRESRIQGREVHKVVYSHIPRKPDELELLIGDLVYVSGDALENSPDGWVEGVSWLSGCRGLILRNYIERTAESDAWTMHRNVPLCCNPQLSPLEEIHSRLLHLNLSDISSMSPSNKPSMAARKNCKRAIPSPQSVRLSKLPEPDPNVARRIFITRHAERVDFTFGDWMSQCIDQEGNYKPNDLNMPDTIPRRIYGPDGFSKDCPLTKVGELQATLLGEAFRNSNTPIHYVYVSPSLRCLQTARIILTAMGIEHLVPMNVEPGLFEWLGWYNGELPEWMVMKELKDDGFNLNMSYRPLMTEGELDGRKETMEWYYMRSSWVMRSIIKATAAKGGNTLCVGHAQTLDTLTRQVVGGGPRSYDDSMRITQKVPYCGTAMITQTGYDRWEFRDLPFAPIGNSGNMTYDSRILLS